MKKCFGYIRVSTTKQGSEGVSLVEQKAAIERYAAANTIELVEWFEEQQTAAKRGRPIFGKMLSRLRKGDAVGVVIHKIDRSARNLKDWADLGNLIDQGIDVHFATESLDLHSRGGRLSADIQAVVAADYIRNLREETRKGFYGRLKQGLYPLPAPVGYLDCGKGKPKDIDPIKGPLVKRLFDLYATGRWSLNDLLIEVERMGLRGKRDGNISLTGLCAILHNPFYAGVIKLSRTGETFEGCHRPLITMNHFKAVQDVFAGKRQARAIVHDYPFRRMFQCTGCGYSLIGERQKGTVYYRCHTKGCPTTSVREDTLDERVAAAFKSFQLRDQDCEILYRYLEELRADLVKTKYATLNNHILQLQAADTRLNRLTDTYVDGIIEKDLFEERRAALVVQKRDAQDRMNELQANPQLMADKVAGYLERARTAYPNYENATVWEKRELLESVTSNRSVMRKNVAITLKSPFQVIAESRDSLNGAPYRNVPRTCKELLRKLLDRNSFLDLQSGSPQRESGSTQGPY